MSNVAKTLVNTLKKKLEAAGFTPEILVGRSYVTDPVVHTLTTDTVCITAQVSAKDVLLVGLFDNPYHEYRRLDMKAGYSCKADSAEGLAEMEHLALEHFSI